MFENSNDKNSEIENTTFSLIDPPKKRNRKTKKQNESEIMKNYIEDMNELKEIKEIINLEKLDTSPCFSECVLSPNFEEHCTEKKSKSNKIHEDKSENIDIKSKKLNKGLKKANDKKSNNIQNDSVQTNNVWLKNIEQKMMKAKNHSQEQYVNMLNCKDKKIVFAIGPAGTGKTLFATQYAIKQFLLGNFDKIIFTRPTVSVDEDIGFLPGSIEEKLSPWLRPIFDILYEFISVKEVQTLLEEKIFEMSPIGYLRGRTFKRSFIIADEMQNCTQNQMKMLLTRIGENSRMVITGDLEQHDRIGKVNGLADFLSKFRKKRSDSIGMIEFEQNDILREPIIKEVLEIYSIDN
jgi:phosphate starvation-inducible PhoH-like protein